MDFMNMFCKEEDHALDRILGAAAGITAGLGLMYLLDPSMGRRRRSMIMEGASNAAHQAGVGVEHAWQKTTEAVGGAAEKVAEGAKNVAEKATSMFSGGSQEPGRSMEPMDEPWSPTTRMLVGTAGGALVAYGMTQRFPVACALGTVGLGLVARAVTNFEIEEYLGMGRGREEPQPDHQQRVEQPKAEHPRMERPPVMKTASEQSYRPSLEPHPAPKPYRVNSK